MIISILNSYTLSVKRLSPPDTGFTTGMCDFFLGICTVTPCQRLRDLLSGTTGNFVFLFFIFLIQMYAFYYKVYIFKWL